MIRTVLVLLCVALLVTACGDEPSSGDDVRQHTVPYVNGYQLHCISFKGGGHGTYSGVACDFVRFWKENAN